jgi:DNA-directed RNA polymerase specialized sigma24 family protein
MKTCTQCRVSKRLSGFHHDSTRKDGKLGNCKDCNRARVKAAQERARSLVFAHYGEACACCGSTENLCLDHIHGNGAEHRALAVGGGVTFYIWLVARDFPPECEPGGEFELGPLCDSCNLSKALTDHCRMHCDEHAHPTRRTVQVVAAEKAVRDARILELRGEGLTQAEIGRIVGVTQPTVGRVLRLAEFEVRDYDPGTQTSRSAA